MELSADHQQRMGEDSGKKSRAGRIVATARRVMFLMAVLYLVVAVVCGTGSLYYRMWLEQTTHGKGWGAIAAMIALGGLSIGALIASGSSFVCWRCLARQTTGAIAVGLLVNAVLALWPLIPILASGGHGLLLLLVVALHTGVCGALICASWTR
jgi:hypothetical protein